MRNIPAVITSRTSPGGFGSMAQPWGADTSTGTEVSSRHTGSMTASSMTAGSTTAGGGEADIASAAALFADPTRARVLMALGDGRALPASVLAAEAGVTPQAASAQLARLQEAGLLAVERSGRHRYYRLDSPQVVAVLEA